MFIFQYSRQGPSNTAPPVLNPSETSIQVRISDICRFTRSAIDPLQHNAAKEKAYLVLGALEKMSSSIVPNAFGQGGDTGKKFSPSLAIQLLDQLHAAISDYRNTLQPKI